MDESRPAPRLPDEDEMRVLAEHVGMDTDPARLAVYRSMMRKLLDDIAALEREDVAGLEPAATFDPRWE